MGPWLRGPKRPGAPSSQYYPFDDVRFKVPSIGRFSEAEFRGSGIELQARKYDMREGNSEYVYAMKRSQTESPSHVFQDLSLALNYGQGTGSSQLLGFVTEHTELVHNPPFKDWKCVLTGGNTSALDLAFRTFTERGDYILVEEYTYPTAFETSSPLGIKFAGIRMDPEGPLPSSMSKILEDWDENARGGKKPHILYTIPTGQNPSGATQSLERRREIYGVAQKHDVYILEDDPYYFIQMLPKASIDRSSTQPPTSQASFISSLIPSFLSIDTDGRVLRMDSFSKIIAPGTRTGWVTASEQIIDRFVRAHETSLQNPSGFSQIMLFKLLHEGWGHSGMINWLFHLRLEYTKRRDAMMAACETYLPHRIVSWSPPKAGFFAWLKINYSLHPHNTTKTPRAIEREIYEATIESGALVVPGSWFQADQDAELPELFFRVTFASLNCEDTAEAIKRFGVAVRACFGVDSC
ncbi:hypothetical protein FGG08_003860 [Glutinoglossum americanum]|uniref:Aminotransferase class I/classII large domain-containing protein n=1 Tax=Glutinoglossum americanum TaxID=1670608 RepID=A0A9P8I8S1_9PEZI|nr:hypothetical protein FGG08_003860 [Glutinoglossum americanum]